MRAAFFGLILRHSVNAICGLVYLVQSERSPVGVGLAIVLIGWGSYRLVYRRRLRPAWLVWIDYALVIAVALTIPETIGQLDIAESNSLPLAVCGSGVLSFTFSQRHWHAMMATLGIAVSFGIGATPLPQVESPFDLFWPYFFFVQCVIGVALRQLVERSARAADSAAADLAATQRQATVAQARRAAQREHWATVHDTAAATMLMIGQGVPLDDDRLRRQATRDLHALTQTPATVSVEEIDLAPVLRATIGESSLTISTPGPWQATAPQYVALAVAGAVREALTNIDRHAGVRSASVTLAPESVEVQDSGCGFQTTVRQSNQLGHGRGISNSIVERMRAVGGTATVSARLGGGTRVRLDWAEKPAPRLLDPLAPARRARRISRGYGVGITGIALVMTLLLPAAIYGPHLVSEPVQLGLVGILLIATLLGAAELVMARGLPRAIRSAAVAAVIAVTFVQPLTIAEHFGAGDHWALGITGWAILTLVLAAPQRQIALVLILNWAVNVAAAAMKGELDVLTLEVLGYSTGSVLAVQMIAGVFPADLRQNAYQAADEAYANAQLTAQQEVSERVQSDYQRRYVALSATTLPLLEALATATLTARSPGVKERAAVESARMRRLFVQSDGQLQRHPLAQALQEVTADAETRGVAVALEVPIDLSPVDSAAIEQLLEVPILIISAARRTARIVVSDTPQLQISVVADSAVEDLHSAARQRDPAFDVRIEYIEDQVWVQSTALVGRSTEALRDSINESYLPHARHV